MDVIANNISNVNTVGFKSSRVSFAEIYSQTVASASGPNPDAGRGGTNPMQIGLGATVSAIDLLMTTGGAQRTDDPYHLMIQGDNGFFVVKDNNGTYYTRAGNFRVDLAGNLTMPNGMIVQGWRASYGAGNRLEIDKNELKDITLLPSDLYAVPETTTRVEMTGNMNALVEGLEGIERTVGFYDSLGNYYTLRLRYTYNENRPVPDGLGGMTPGGPAFWTVQVGNQMYANGDRDNPVSISAGFAVIPATDPQFDAFEEEVGNLPQRLTLNILTPADAGFGEDFAWVNTPLAGMEATSRVAFNNLGMLTGTDTPIAGQPPNMTGLVMNVSGAANIKPAAVFGNNSGNVFVDMREVTPNSEIPPTLCSRLPTARRRAP
jgi:flagellar hook-basal body protein